MRRRHSISNKDSVLYETKLKGSTKYQTVKEKKKRNRKFVFLSIVLILGAILFYFGSIGFSAISAANEVLPENISFRDIISRSSLKQTDGITNILLLGKDQAAGLTDTIQIVRLRASDDRVAMVSVPRDLQVTIPGNGKEKINAVYKIGYSNSKVSDKKGKEADGVKLLESTVKEVVGVPIHYYVTLDFIGLKSVVDSLGGITVDVETAFYDPQYPKDYFTKTGEYVKTDGYEPFSVKAGEQRMDGVTALKYSRSRHGSNGEDSDFARAARQQQVVMAIKEKALSLDFLTNPIKISNLLESLGDHVKTDMGVPEFKDFINNLKDLDTSKVISKVLSTDSKDGLLISVNEGGYYIKPKAGDFSQVQKFVQNIFDKEDEIKPEVEIYNGSGTAGLATKFAKRLEGVGIYADKVETNDEEVSRTVIYNGSGKTATFDEVSSLLTNAKIESYSEKNIIKVVIGSDYGE